MGVRLNKVLRDFNVGLQTVVDFLEKKGYKVEADLNAKLSDEAYQIVRKEFGDDKMLKNEVEKLMTQRQENKEKKVGATPRKEEMIKTEIPQDVLPQFKTVGQINLEKSSPKATTSSQPKKTAAEAIKPQATPKEKVGEEKKDSVTPKKAEPASKEQPEKKTGKKQEKPLATQAVAPVQNAVTEKTQQEQPVQY